MSANNDGNGERIYLSPPHVFGLERELLADALDSNWIAPLGPHVDAFEREMAGATGRRHAAALSSGTAALHLCVRLFGIGDGDEVLVSSLTFSATVNAIVLRARGARVRGCHAGFVEPRPRVARG